MQQIIPLLEVAASAELLRQLHNCNNSKYNCIRAFLLFSLLSHAAVSVFK